MLSEMSDEPKLSITARTRTPRRAAAVMASRTRVPAASCSKIYMMMSMLRIAPASRGKNAFKPLIAVDDDLQPVIGDVSGQRIGIAGRAECISHRPLIGGAIQAPQGQCFD
jgi:hypothetical protein